MVLGDTRDALRLDKGDVARLVDRMRQHTPWRWRLDEVYVKINGEMHDLCRARGSVAVPPTRAVVIAS